MHTIARKNKLEKKHEYCNLMQSYAMLLIHAYSVFVYLISFANKSICLFGKLVPLNFEIKLICFELQIVLELP